jgi:hypothetical protein
MTRRIALDRPPDGDRVDGVVISDWRPLPHVGQAVEVEALDGSKWKSIGWVCEVDAEKHEYSVELMEKAHVEDER